MLHSHSTNRNTSTEIPAANQTENSKNEALQNEIEVLKKETDSVKKGYSVTPQIPTR